MLLPLNCLKTMDDPVAVETVIRSAFMDMPAIRDQDLCAVDPNSLSSAVEGLEPLRGKHRYELLDHLTWIDFGVLYRLTPYAVWYFAPTFMVLALRHLHRHEFYELMQPFRLPEALLEDVGVDTHASLEDMDEALSGMDIRRRIEAAGTQEGVKPHHGDLGLAWFGRQAHFYSPAERAAVAGFLGWLSTEWPLAPCVALARKHFWQVAGN